MGAGGTFNGYSGSPDQTDGILPLGTQQYPGNTFQQNLTYPTYNISHQEANDPIDPMLREFRNVLANHFGVAPRGTSGGGGGDPPPCEPVPPQLMCER